MAHQLYGVTHCADVPWAVVRSQPKSTRKGLSLSLGQLIMLGLLLTVLIVWSLLYLSLGCPWPPNPLMR
jgi:hypothetical protein